MTLWNNVKIINKEHYWRGKRLKKFVHIIYENDQIGRPSMSIHMSATSKMGTNAEFIIP